MDIKKNLVGKRYGRLVVTEELGHGYVMCHCDCGNNKKIRKWQIMQGAIHSCGCLRRETVPGHGDIKSQKWLAKNYESITIHVPKGTKDKIKEWAAAHNMSMASYIQEACEEKAAK